VKLRVFFRKSLRQRPIFTCNEHLCSAVPVYISFVYFFPFSFCSGYCFFLFSFLSHVFLFFMFHLSFSSHLSVKQKIKKQPFYPWKPSSATACRAECGIHTSCFYLPCIDAKYLVYGMFSKWKFLFDSIQLSRNWSRMFIYRLNIYLSFLIAFYLLFIMLLCSHLLSTFFLIWYLYLLFVITIIILIYRTNSFSYSVPLNAQHIFPPRVFSTPILFFAVILR
jgi:hypothetical protein